MDITRRDFLGTATKATPDGRKDGDRLAQGFSPSEYRCKEGVTTVLNAIGMLPHECLFACRKEKMRTTDNGRDPAWRNARTDKQRSFLAAFRKAFTQFVYVTYIVMGNSIMHATTDDQSVASYREWMSVPNCRTGRSSSSPRAAVIRWTVGRCRFQASFAAMRTERTSASRNTGSE